MYKSIIIKIFFLVHFIFLFSCEREVASMGKVVVQIPKHNKIEQMISEITLFGQGEPPGDWEDVDCVGFLVSGPESALRQNSCELLDGFNGEKIDDFRFGPTFAGFYMGGDVLSAEIEIASGSDRVITAVGFKTHMTAANGADIACKNILSANKRSFSKAFVYAQSGKFKVDSGTTQSVVLPVTYEPDDTPFLGDCAGPTAPGGSEYKPGPPVSVRVRIQDDLDSMMQYSCVAIAVELLDSQGQLATVDADYEFDIGSGPPALRTTLNFYNEDVGTNRNCDSGTAQGTKSIDFFSGGQRFPRVVLFVSPIVTSGTYQFTLNQTDTNTVLTKELPLFDIEAFTSPSAYTPLTVSLFDIKSFRSSNSTSASNPIYVHSNECRPAVAQVLDNQGRPIKITNNHATASNYIDSMVSTLYSGAIGPSIMYSRDNCTTTVASENFNLDSGDYSFSGLNVFSYIVSPGYNGGRFNFRVGVSGTGFYDSSIDEFLDLDPTAALNYKSYFMVKD